ncbi:cobyrinic acid a,c-diamide synthase [bacterium]|nr:cobyrinic acid a,c-diamide synthase [bacterium]
MLLPDPLKADTIWDRLPTEARAWAEGLPWEQRRYVLSICHLLCAHPPEVQAEFLDDYTADGLVSRLLEDYDTKQKVNRYLKHFCIDIELTEPVLRDYIRQFYIHCAQDLRCQPEQYLEAAIRLMSSTKESNNAFNYVLGFELLRMMFSMSWLQHERLYLLQKNQEDFLHLYIKPIQHAHKVNNIVVPKDEKRFFAKRDYYVQVPDIKEKKLYELVMATFTAKSVVDFGFAVIRHTNFLRFNREFIFRPEAQEGIFS